MACRPGLGEYFLQSHLVDEVIEIDKRSPEGRRRARHLLKEREWDIVLVPHESVRTALWMSGVKSKRGKVAFRKWWNWMFYSRRVRKPKQLPDALRQMSLLTAYDKDLAAKFEHEVSGFESPRNLNSPLDLTTPKIPDWASMKVSRCTAQSRRIFLAPGSVWATKRWTAEGYEELARELIKRGYQVELVGSKDEKALCEQIAARVPGVKNLAGTTSLGGLVELFTQGTALVCNDSGAMHAAAAAGLPTVTVFGPTTLIQGFRPWQDRAIVVQRDLTCRPCGRHGAQTCPIGTHECMKTIKASEVLEALDRLLNK